LAVAFYIFRNWLGIALEQTRGKIRNLKLPGAKFFVEVIELIRCPWKCEKLPAAWAHLRLLQTTKTAVLQRAAHGPIWSRMAEEAI
jgi:hypothetical protein